MKGKATQPSETDIKPLTMKPSGERALKKEEIRSSKEKHCH